MTTTDQGVPGGASRDQIDDVPPRIASEPVVRRRRVASRAQVAPLGHEPALDGLRALAVTAVLLYHARFGWMQGGFLGVSVFFTLSGFLITSLLLREWDRSGGIDKRRFWSRRFRRLLPASWLTILLVVAMGAAGVWNDAQLRDLRGDVPAALLQIINWRFVVEGTSYGAQFAAPSPLQHYWSLAIEEQFYLFLPLLVAGLLALGDRHRGRLRRSPLVIALVGLTAASAAASWWFGRDDVNRAYFGTETRMAELLFGALLACLLLRRVRVRAAVVRALFGLLGLAALVAVAWLCHVSSVSDTWLYPWGLLGTATATTLVILGALQGGPLGRLLSLAPLVWLGRISYGVYLVHWPVFLWLSPTRVALAPWPLFGVRMAVTVAVSAAMFHVVELPVRADRRTARVARYAAIPLVVAIVAGSMAVTDHLAPPSTIEAASASATTIPPAPVRVLVVGDELAASWQPGAGGSQDNPIEVTTAAAPNCGLAVGGWVALPDGKVERDIDRCGQVRDTWVRAATDQRPDVVLVWGGVRDVADRRLSLDTGWAAPGDASVDDILTTQIRDLFESLAGTGAAVVVGTVPHMRSQLPAPAVVPPRLPNEQPERNIWLKEHTLMASGAPAPHRATDDDARVDRWNAILTNAATAEGVGMVDLADAIRSWPGGEFDPSRRAVDGVGLTVGAVGDLAASTSVELAAARPAVAPADPAVGVADAAQLPVAPPVTPRRTVSPGRSASVLVAGDSVAFNIGIGLAKWSGRAGDPMSVQPYGEFGCPIARGGQYRFLRNPETFRDECDWSSAFARLLNQRQPQVVVISTGIWEVVDRRLKGDDRFRHVGDPVIDQYLRSEFLSAIDLMASRGATVVFLTSPHFEAARDQGYTDLPENEPGRVDHLNALIAEVVGRRPGVASMIDLQAWLGAQPGGELDAAHRPDGLHFSDAYAAQIGAWLGPQLIAVARQGPSTGG